MKRFLAPAGGVLLGALLLLAPPTLSADPPGSTPIRVAVQPQPGPLLIPVAGVSASQLFDTFNQSRGGHPHEAIDIAAPLGTPVVAVDDGKVVKLFNSKPGGLTVYQFDSAQKLAYYYAHLDRYAPGLAEKQELKRGELVGYVGSTGNADPAAPHLHFAIFALGPEKRWWQGTAINPYPFFAGR
ncbi:MAG TPA: M23 family metallopeptidase [Burkholderiales bacterium]|jgi:murein DD-endopeptidase MepM/ murein hydrolase activator NlpD|nr:M23 family metallopeptidase [Burkholderiales bacterium]